MSKKVIDLSRKQERAVLVGVIGKTEDPDRAQEYLDELAFLAETASIVPVKQFFQRLEKPDSATFVGKGKLEQISQFVTEHEIEIVLFDDELTPSQQRNLERELKRKIIDRTFLILEIFASRARTSHAKKQVELAQYQYLFPRLKGMWTHLERQRGGTGTRGGAGEKEIETDRRIVRDRIALLKEELKEIDKQMATQRKSRGELIRVALVGYTNVGKSTIMNLISKSEVFAENKLFATLDTTVRKVVIGNLPFLLSDTVGFIRKLPTQLVESFKSTLDEVREADILLHVVDIAHPQFEEQIEIVNTTLAEIGAKDKIMIMVFNKVDAYVYTPKEEDDLGDLHPENVSLDQLKKSWMGKTKEESVFLSASQKINIEEFKTLLYDRVKEMHSKRYPYNNLLY